MSAAKFKIALAQLNSTLGEIDENIRKAKEVVEEAASRNVRIICFPELFTSGYTIFDKLDELAEPIPGPTTEQIGVVAEKYQLYIILGIAERGKSDDAFYNTAVIIGPTGNLIGKYRKVHLWEDERNCFTAGEYYRVFETEIGRLGIGICYDLEFPEVSRILALQGAEAIFFPTNNSKPWGRYWDIYLKSRAAENGVFIVGVNRVGIEGKLEFFGMSGIVEPDGKMKASASGKEEILYSTIDLKKVKLQRKILKYLNERVPYTYKLLSMRNVGGTR